MDDYTTGLGTIEESDLETLILQYEEEVIFT
jgi:hypothetical protein